MHDILNKILIGSDSLYVLDLSWFLHRNYYVFREMGVDINGFKRPTGHLYGFFSTLKMIRQVSPNSVIIITQDGTPIERNQELATLEGGYKDGRSELEFNFYKDIPLIKAAACVLPKVYWAFNEDKECDDLMYALSKQAEETDFNGKIYVYSGDNDLLQTIDNRISVIRTKGSNGFNEITNEVVMTDEKFTKKFHGVDTAHITNFRAICGDSSDNIKGIPRFPRDLAVKVAMSTEDISKEHHYLAQTKTEEKWLNILDENYSVVQRNYRVMKLISDFEVKISRPKVNYVKLIETLYGLRLNSYINYLELIKEEQ